MPSLPQQMRANRAAQLAREAAVAATILHAFRQAQRHIAPAQQSLISAYATQLQRLRNQQQQDAQAANDDGDGDDEYDGEYDAADLPPPRVSPPWLASTHEAHHLAMTLLLTIGAFALTSRLAITDGQQQALTAGAADATALLAHTVVGEAAAAASLALPVQSLLDDTVVGRSTFSGKLLASLIDQLGPATVAKAEKALQAALAAGASPETTARMLTDVTNMAYSRALTISRTEIMGAYRMAMLETLRANSAVASGWLWSAAADACAACTEMDGTEHPLDEDMVSHPNCRCEMQPIPAAALTTTADTSADTTTSDVTDDAGGGTDGGE